MVEARTGAGTVRGAVESGIAVFRGIPFAAPPVGELRFAVPHPVPAWDGVREALAFGPPPPQAGVFGMDGIGAEGNDWLTVNVWSPDLSGDLPVMVWIQGGAYTVGMSGLPEYDGARLALDGVVVVTFNYRVGIEGFALIDGAPANRGLLDQVAALEWVRAEIRAFGGDPGRVTVFGQSAGGGSVAALLAMPRAAGLFQRAIASSVPGTFFTPELAADIASVCAAELGLRPTATDLSTVEPTVLPMAGDEVMAKIGQFTGRWGSAAHKAIPFAPVVDGDVLPVSPWEALESGAARDVVLIAGHTRHEQRLLTALDNVLGAVTPEQAAQALDVFAPGADYPALTAEELFEVVCSDWLFRMPSLHLAEAHARGGGRAFVYEVTWEDGPLGACHGIDVPLVFGNPGRGQTAAVLGEITDATKALADQLRTAWSSFAVTGDPGWPAYTLDERLTRLFDVPPAVAPYPEEASRRLWSGHRFNPLPLLE